jgi:hypothetical protein
MLFFALFAVFMSAAWVIVAYAMKRAEDGYEDAAGFHFSPQNATAVAPSHLAESSPKTCEPARAQTTDSELIAERHI